MAHLPAWFRRAARSLLLGAGGLVALALAAFVVVLAFADHPWYAGAVVAVTVLAIVLSERARRRERRVRDAARTRRALE